MKVLHVNFAKGFRGGERQTELLTRSLAEAGWRQGILLRYDSPLIEKLQDVKKLEIIEVRKPYFRKRVPVGQFDFCHAHETKAAQWACINHLLCKTPYVITRRVPKVPKSDWFTRSIYRHATVTICLSTEIRENLLKTVPTAATHIIPSMCANLHVDEKLLQKLREKYRGKYVIGNIGALVKKHKGQHILLEALKGLDSDGDVYCLILGDGYDRELLEQQAAGQSNVEFLGFQSDIGTYLKLFDLFVYPSLEEGLGSTLLDAMQAGCPIVASDVGGIPEIVHHEEHGLLVPPGRSAPLRAGIDRLRASPELAQRFIAAGRKQAENYSPRLLAEKNAQLYRAVIAKTKVRMSH